MVTLSQNAYFPEKGDLIWINFNPQSGHEQSGLRPALIVSPASYNQQVGLALICPITTKIKGYPFEVILPDTCKVKGAVLSDQIKNLDWRTRQAKFIAKAPLQTIYDVIAKIKAIIIQ